MRLFLLFYVILILILNVVIDDDLMFLLALTTFPVSVYLLVTKAKQKPRKNIHQKILSTRKIIENKEENFHKSSEQR